MLADADTARFITREGRPYSERRSWAEFVFLTGHWQVLGYGMFVVEERETGRFIGRVGALQPMGWPGLEVAWAMVPSARGKGYATEAATAVVDWVFCRFDFDRIISVIDPRNTPSQRVAQRLGERRTTETFAPFAEPCDVWEISRSEWYEARGAE